MKIIQKNLLMTHTLALLLAIPVANSQTLEVKDFGQGAVQSTTMIDTGVGLANGDVWIWGFKGSGQQGNGILDQNASRHPIKVNNLPTIVSVIGGAHHIIATDYEGYLWSWGQNIHGEAGCQGSPYANYVITPCKLKTSSGQYLQGVSQIAAAGEYHTVYLDKYGDVYTSGLYTLGRIGHGYVAQDARLPRKVNIGGEHARLIGAAYEGSFAVTYEGNVWAWGDNEAYGLALPVLGEHIWSPTKVPKLKPYAHKIVQIGGGQPWGQALLDDGRVIGWGYYGALGQSCGRITQNVTYSPEIIFVPIEKVIQISMRYESTIVLTEDNEIYTWGGLNSGVYANIQGWCPKKAPLSEAFRREHGKVVKIGTGKHQIYYEMEDGTAWGVGYNAGGQIKWGAGTPILNFPGVQLNNIPYP